MTGVGTIFGGDGTSSGGRERPDLSNYGYGVIAARPTLVRAEVHRHPLVRPNGGLLRAQKGPLHGHDVRALLVLLAERRERIPWERRGDGDAETAWRCLSSFYCD